MIADKSVDSYIPPQDRLLTWTDGLSRVETREVGPHGHVKNTSGGSSFAPTKDSPSFTRFYRWITHHAHLIVSQTPSINRYTLLKAISG